jgi:hypothetical protein
MTSGDHRARESKNVKVPGADLEIGLRLPELARCFPVLLHDQKFEEANMGRGILLWLLGVPIPVIILLWLFFGR